MHFNRNFLCFQSRGAEWDSKRGLAEQDPIQQLHNDVETYDEVVLPWTRKSFSFFLLQNFENIYSKME